jgi:hypothetical protein
MQSRAIIIALLVAAFCLLAADASAGRRVRTFSEQGEVTKQKDPAPKPGKEQPFSKLTKDRVAIKGLFTFYHDTTDHDMLMEIKPEHIGPIYLCGESRVQSDGRYTDNGAMLGTYPFYFKRVGKTIMLMEKNLRLRADSTAPVRHALDKAISDHLIASATIKSLPNDSGAVLIDAAELFVRDASNLSYLLGQAGKTGHRFDSKNSYFDKIKSFPQNSEISVKLHYQTSQPQSGITLQDGYSMYHTYHYSLSTLPETDYQPRVADDRIGYFLTQWQDYTQMDRESAYIRYINRWHLKKKNPDARISEPVEPIVFWVDKATPEEYRDAVAEAIEFWNPCFEAIGFRNAIVAKQMPDTASWDPADVRYNVVQWMINPGAAYAVGPSRANPFTGQIYDADIRLSVDWIRYMFSSAEEWISPTVGFDGAVAETFDPAHLLHEHEADQPFHACSYQREAAIDGAQALTYLLSSAGDFVNKDSLTKAYVHSYLVEIVAHEVGHCLGLRHNFKASSIYTLEQLADPEFTRRHSTSGTIMDYMPANIAPPGGPQGEFYSSCPGPWDFWVIEYGYSDWGDIEAEDEAAKLKQIASRSGEPELIFLTDEDTFGWSTKGIDPLSNTHDLGADPLRYAQRQLEISDHIWNNVVETFEKPGNNYTKLRSVFQNGWRAYSTMALVATRHVGGIYMRRHHIGDAEGKVPFEVVPASEQRRAVAMLDEHLFAPDAFKTPEGILNKLLPERFPDFMWSNYGISSLDFPIHQYALMYQRQAIDRLYDPNTLGRLVNNLPRYPQGAEKYTMYDMFTQVRQSIWKELASGTNPNSFRRQLQLVHLDKLIEVYLAKAGKYPFDAYSLAASNLETLEAGAKRALNVTGIDGMTKAHYGEVVRQIEAARSAARDYATR